DLHVERLHGQGQRAELGRALGRRLGHADRSIKQVSTCCGSHKVRDLPGEVGHDGEKYHKRDERQRKPGIEVGPKATTGHRGFLLLGVTDGYPEAQNTDGDLTMRSWSASTR